ncbi:MAG: uracil phosphoribosyltransferase [Flavobacteriales bacterium]|nr:uracil phosphoribosyltransferase [Flavobacteriales bacterium]
MKIVDLSAQPTIVNQYMAEIRDQGIQQDRMRFRRNIERIGIHLAYELSKDCSYSSQSVQTPLGVSEVSVPREQPVVASILRAGVPLHSGVLEVFDRADNAYISAYREVHADHSFKVVVEYLACPDLTDRHVILCDPMLATGRSMVLAYEALLTKVKPKRVDCLSVIASREGVEYVSREMKGLGTLYVAAVDEEMNDKKYIVPGLGDAGDLAFGPKL